MILYQKPTAYPLVKKLVNLERIATSLIFVDHQTLVKLAGSRQPGAFGPGKIWQPENCENDLDRQAFLDSVRQTVGTLGKKHRQVIEMYFFENLNISQIEQETGQSQPQVQKLLREAMLMLKCALANIVCNRWPDRFQEINRCPICRHPKRKTIEKVISDKKKPESWATMNKRLKKMVGETFNPPSIMINHMKYHRRS